MVEMIGTTLSYIWEGLTNLPVFDLGITWSQLLIGTVVISISVSTLKQIYGIGTGVMSKIGKNRRKNNNEIDH